MGRPNKLNVSEANTQNVTEVVTRTLKKVRAFTQAELNALVVAAYKAEENVATTNLENLAVAVVAALVSSGKVTNESGNYKVVVGKRGRPKKVVEAAAAV